MMISENPKYDKYFAVLDDDLRVKIFILQAILADRGVDSTASEVIDIALDYMKKVIDCEGWQNVTIES